MDYPPIPQFSLDFLLRSKTYVKEHPPNALQIYREFPLSSLFENVVRLVYIHTISCKLHWLCCTVVYTTVVGCEYSYGTIAY